MGKMPTDKQIFSCVWFFFDRVVDNEYPSCFLFYLPDFWRYVLPQVFRAEFVLIEKSGDLVVAERAFKERRKTDSCRLMRLCNQIVSVDIKHVSFHINLPNKREVDYDIVMPFSTAWCVT